MSLVVRIFPEEKNRRIRGEKPVLSQTIIYCVTATIHNSISKIYLKVQVLSSDFFEVNELLDEH